MIRSITVGCLSISIASFALTCTVHSQEATVTQRQILFVPKKVDTKKLVYHLLASEEEQEPGNAVPVLLRMIYGRQPFVNNVLPRLYEYAEMEISDPRLPTLDYDYFAEQVIRAGLMSEANWEYPLRTEDPYAILLPDLQAQRSLVGDGMMAWIKQRLSRGEIDAAIRGIQGQLGYGRHIARTPFYVSHLIGLRIAASSLDSLEFLMQFEESPNLYWSLGILPPTLQDVGPMIRYELWVVSSGLSEPLPPIGDQKWISMARRFMASTMDQATSTYTAEKIALIQARLEGFAKRDLPRIYGYSEAEMQQMREEERIMRWLYFQYCRLRVRFESLTYQTPKQILAAKEKLNAELEPLLAEIGLNESPFLFFFPDAILTCRTFERRVKFLQTIEAIRDYAFAHGGKFPADLSMLDLPAPNDPFTEQPFEYRLEIDHARLSQSPIDDLKIERYDYELRIKQ